MITAFIERWLQKKYNFANIDKVIDGVTSLYLRRYYINGYMSQRFGGKPVEDHDGSIFLHKICRSDEDKDPHDHPWTFFTVILWGGYTDEQWQPTEVGGRMIVKRQWCGIGSMHMRDRKHLHRVILKPGTTVWSLVFTSPKQGSWGFYTEKGWVHWRKYLNISEGQASV